MKAELKTITPEWAKKILNEKNTGNRPLSRLHVDTLAREISKGRWKVNGDTICLNGDMLIDGQHRLAAVVQSGVAIQAFVIDNLPSDVFDTKDIGKRRSAGDTLGVRGERNACRLAACLLLIDKYMTGRVDKFVAYSNSEIEDLLEKYPEARESIQVTIAARGLLTPSVLDACHYLFSRKNLLLADEFVKKVVTGIGMQEGDPWYILRERLVKNSLAKSKLQKPYLMALCIKAWNCARSGKSVRFLRWREEGEAIEMFPIIK